MKTAISFVLTLMVLGVTEGGNVLVIPQDGSHWLSMRNLVDKLFQRGHQIVVVVPEISFHLQNLHGYTVKTFTSPYSREFMETMMKEATYEVLEGGNALLKAKLMYDKMVHIGRYSMAGCKSLLYNDTLIKYLEASRFDAIMSDPLFPCGEIIAEYLSIPTVLFLRGVVFGIDEEATQTPSPVSYVPRLHSAFPDHMNFNQRVKNFLMRTLDLFLCQSFYAPFAQLASDFLQREVRIEDLLARASVWLLRVDHIFEFPKPFMPNMVFIGGINCVNQNPLKQVENIIAYL